MSNGAEMVYRMSAEMGGRLAAIAPATPMSLITFTGTPPTGGGNQLPRASRHGPRAGGMLRSYRPHAR